MAEGLPSLPLDVTASPQEWHEEGERCAGVCVALRGPLFWGENIATGPCPHAAVFLPESEGGLRKDRAMAFGLGRQARSHMNAMRGVRN